MISTIFNISVLLPTPSHTSFLEKRNKASFPSQVVIFYQIWPRRQVENTNYLGYLVNLMLILKQGSQRLQNESAIHCSTFLLFLMVIYIETKNECVKAKSCRNILTLEYPNQQISSLSNFDHSVRFCIPETAAENSNLISALHQGSVYLLQEEADSCVLLQVTDVNEMLE